MGRHQQDPFQENSFYHVYNRAVGSDLLFRDKSDYHKFLTKADKYFGPHWDFLSYCLVPNHFHFVIRVNPIELDYLRREATATALKLLREEITLDQYFSAKAANFFSGFALSYNRRYNRKGALFKEGVKRVRMNNVPRVLSRIAYNHHNVIHHNLGNDYASYRYTSYNAYLSDFPTKIARDLGLELFGGRENFKDYHEDFKREYRELMDF